MIEFPFIGGTYPDQALPFSSQRTVNLYPEEDPNYKQRIVLNGFPGHRRWTQCGNGPVRGKLQFGDKLIVVSGSTVYSVNAGGGSTAIGVMATSSGRVSMDENGTQVMIVDGQDGWIWNGSTFSKITDPVFTATKADQVTHMDSYFVVNEPGTGRIWVSDSFDGLGWNATRTATAEFKSDPIVTVKADRELYLGGTFTTQGYYNSGASPMPFEAIRSARLIYGVAARDSWVIVGNTSYFLAQDANGALFVGRLNGASVERVSTRAWERVWSSYGYQTAFAHGVHFEGHEWYVITFPDADHDFGRTFCFSIQTGLWFEIGPYQPSVGDFGAHPMLTHTFFSGRNLFGAVDGWLYEMKGDVFTFQDDTMISLRRSPVLHDKREDFSLHKASFDVETGVENDDEPDPKLIFRMSRDGGYTYKNTRYKSLKGSSSNKRLSSIDFDMLGMAKDWVFEISVADPVRRRFVGAYVK